MYKYETHCHTSETSACSKICGADLARYYASMGYAGIIVTDHFFNGNTTVPRIMPWRKRVELFIKGWENARDEGKKLGLDVFFGWEFSFEGTDYLTYGLSPEWLLEHDEIMHISTREYLRFARSEGAIIVHAHPFRQAGYIDHIKLFPADVDGVEIDNSSMNEITNKMGKLYAETYGLLQLAGSDTHNSGKPRLAGVQFEKRLQSIDDFVSEVRAGHAVLFSDVKE